jgi:hypothetical protein
LGHGFQATCRLPRIRQGCARWVRSDLTGGHSPWSSAHAPLKEHDNRATSLGEALIRRPPTGR